MRKYTFVRIISAMLLAAYLLAIVFFMLWNIPDTVQNVQFKGLRAIGFLKDGQYVKYINEYVDYLVLFIPVGLLYPLARGRRCLSGAVVFTVFSMAVIEVLRYYYSGGVIAIDDEIWAIAGTFTGYGFFPAVSMVLELKEEYLKNEAYHTSGWLGAALLYALVILFLKTMSEENMSLTDLFPSDKAETREYDAEGHDDYDEAAPEMLSSGTEAPGSAESTKEAVHKAIYDRLYGELSLYKDSVVFTDDTIITQDIFDEFLKMMNEHPELFWLTGGAELETVSYGSNQTMTLKPEFASEAASLPDMAAALEASAGEYINKCPDGSEYEKALWVHDMIIQTTAYDPDVLFYTQTVDDPHFDYAYTAYGALVNHKAVCAGYARAYQLILNRLGIECGYISGSAVNSRGETETHAWNYIKADGKYYYVDVTWDDPVDENYADTGHLSHDYFCLSSADIDTDHFPEDGQSLPDCPETRSPY